MSLDPFFNPKSVAVVGVSSKSNKVGRIIFDNLVDVHKKVYPVNPNLKLVDGMKCYPSLRDVGKVELIVVAVSAKSVIEVLEEAGKLGIHHAIIVTSGFKEVK